MRNQLIIAAAFIVFAVFASQHLTSNDLGVVDARPMNLEQTQAAPRAAMVTQSAYYGDEVRIKASNDHQYYVDADINRRTARFLVDTGASYVALRDSDARNAGIYAAYADFTYPVTTANGETKAALVTIDEIEINGLRVDGVKAFILQDDQLSINLLGMSFLSRLESVEASKGELVLRG